MTCRHRSLNRYFHRASRLVDWVGVTVTDAKGKITYTNAFVTSLDVMRGMAWPLAPFSGFRSLEWRAGCETAVHGQFPRFSACSLIPFKEGKSSGSQRQRRAGIAGLRPEQAIPSRLRGEGGLGPLARVWISINPSSTIPTPWCPGRPRASRGCQVGGRPRPYWPPPRKPA